MKKELFEMFRSANDLSGEVILTRLTMAVIIACFIYISYRCGRQRIQAKDKTYTFGKPKICSFFTSITQNHIHRLIISNPKTRP